MLEGLDIEEAARGAAPPVHLWNPPLSGDMDLVVRRDGVWVHEGGPIRREAMVRLFASILRKEGRDYFLVSPVEKFRIRVEDAPFLAVAARATGTGREQMLTFVTNVGDRVEAGPDHPIRVDIDPSTQEPAPYVEVRSGLEARIGRAVFYDLVELGAPHEVDGRAQFGLWSGGRFFAIAPADEVFGA
ncbi:MAG: DUF1285 domain-containing protein [Pseudomonadota bacterium]